MAELTGEEMGRLRVALAELPRLAVWLQMVWHGEWMCSIAADGIAPDDGTVAVRMPGGGVQAVSAAELFVDLADARTADAVARWVAGRVGLQVGCTAPRWVHTGFGVWVLSDGVGAPARFSATRRPDSPAAREGRNYSFPSLHAVDSDCNDARRLPDGSRWVDRAALAIVARHVGVDRG